MTAASNLHRQPSRDPVSEEEEPLARSVLAAVVLVPGVPELLGRVLAVGVSVVLEEGIDDQLAARARRCRTSRSRSPVPRSLQVHRAGSSATPRAAADQGPHRDQRGAQPGPSRRKFISTSFRDLSSGGGDERTMTPERAGFHPAVHPARGKMDMSSEEAHEADPRRRRPGWPSPRLAPPAESAGGERPGRSAARRLPHDLAHAIAIALRAVPGVALAPRSCSRTGRRGRGGGLRAGGRLLEVEVDGETGRVLEIEDEGDDDAADGTSPSRGAGGPGTCSPSRRCGRGRACPHGPPRWRARWAGRGRPPRRAARGSSRTNLSKIRSRSCSGMPWPPSVTASSAVPFRWRPPRAPALPRACAGRRCRGGS